MKISLYSVRIFGILTIISAVALWKITGNGIKQSGVIVDIVLSIFTSCLLLVASSLLSYLVESKKLKNQIMRNYIDVCTAYRELDKSNYVDIELASEKLNIYWRISCGLIEDYKLFVFQKKNSRNAYSVHDLTKEILFMIFELEKGATKESVFSKIAQIEEEIKVINKYYKFS